MLGIEGDPEGGPPEGGLVGSRFVKRIHTASMGAPIVSGRLLPEVARRIAEAKNVELHTCYRERLAKAPTLAGELRVALTIDAQGRVSETVPSGSLTDAPLIACLTTNVFSGLRFPTSAGQPLHVTYPLQFAPGTTISGKSILGITDDDVRAALVAAQCTDVTNRGPAYPDGPTIFTARQAGRAVAVAFVPVSGKRLSGKMLSRLREKCAVYHESEPFAVAVAIEGDDGRSRAGELLGAIVKDPK